MTLDQRKSRIQKAKDRYDATSAGLLKRADCAGTNDKQAEGLEQWRLFNHELDEDPMEINAKKARRFCSFLWLHFPTMSGQQISRKLTAVTGALSKLDIEWSRTRNVSRMLKACRILRPVKHREKRPWSIYHIKLAEKHALTGTLWDEACFAGMLLGWGSLMRCSEFAKTYRKGATILTRGQIEFSPNNKNPKEAYITITKSKTNLFGRKEIINVPCLCFKHTKQKFGNVKVKPACCPLHRIHRYVKLRDHLYGSDPSRPLLLKHNGFAVTYDNMRDWMTKCVDAINKHGGFDRELKREHYPTHCLRQGGTTDCARSGWTNDQIQKLGRWRSDQWRLSYLATDYRDIALLSGLTQNTLQRHSSAG